MCIERQISRYRLYVPLPFTNYIIIFFAYLHVKKDTFLKKKEIEVEIELTANHYGRFEMYLCPNDDPSREATEECFDS